MTPNIISAAKNRIIIDPATAKEFISTPNKFRIISPKNKKTIIIIRDTNEAFSDSITLYFSLSKTIRGMFPTTSIIAKSIIDDEINSFKVFEDDFVAIHREGHPISEIENPGIDDILAQDHLHVSSRKRGLHLIDVELDKIGYRRNVALRCQHFLIAPTIIKSTDMLLFATRSFAKAHNLPFLEIPAEIPSMEYFLIWHKSDEGDGGHIWMKELIINAFIEAKK